MEQYSLHNSDFELIEKIVKITSDIEKIYMQLYYLEINGMKNKQEFNHLLNTLNLAIKTEKKIYSNIYLPYEKIDYIMWYIYENKLKPDSPDEIESLIKQKYDNRIFRRIITTLRKKTIYNDKFIQCVFPKDIFEIINRYEAKKSDGLVMRKIHGCVDLREAIENDTFNIYLILLQEFIDNKEYIMYKNELIRAKYNMAFIDELIEKKMIENKFEVKTPLHLRSGIVADLHEINIDIYKLLKNSIGEKSAIHQISELLIVYDREYDDSEKIISSILRQCMIRANLIIMNDESIMNINNRFKNLIQSRLYYSSHPEDHIGEEHVNKCFQLVKKDKEKTITLSLNNRKN